jgi:hypothetical protein
LIDPLHKAAPGLLIAGADRQYFDEANKIYLNPESLVSARHLGDLLMHVAEGLEAKSMLREDRRLQTVALALSLVALAGVLMDWWNFVNGALSETGPDGGTIPMRIGVSVSLFAALLLLAVILGWRILAGRASKRHPLPRA